MRYLDNLKISTKLSLLILVLIFPMVYFFINNLLEEYSLLQRMERAGTNAEEIRSVNNFLVNLEKEWISGVDYYLEKNSRTTKDFETEEILTNQYYNELPDSYKTTRINGIETELSDMILEFRKGFKVDSIPLENTRARFNKITQELIWEINEVIGESIAVDEQDQIKSLNHLIAAKDFQSSIRFLIRLIIEKPDLFEIYLPQLEAANFQYEYSLDKFQSTLDPQKLEEFRAFLYTEDYRKFNSIKSDVLRGDRNVLNSISRPEWINLSLDIFDLFFQYENQVVDRIVNEVLPLS